MMCLALLLGSQLITRAQGAANTTTDTAAAPATPKTLQEQIEELQSQIDVLKDAINEPEGSIQTTVGDVRTLKKIKISGYIQARYQDNYTKTASSGASAETSTFDVKRARIKVTGTPTDNTTAVIQFDLGDATANGKYNLTTKDAYVGYTFGDGNASLHPTVTLGQLQTPFGYQLVQSSSVRETPEKSLVVRKLLDPVEYDRGIKFNNGVDSRLFYEVGLFNGTGANTTDNNQTKNVSGRVRYKVTDAFDAGGSFYFGNTNAAAITKDLTKDPASTGIAADNFMKQLYGIDAQYLWNDNSLKAEYVTGRELFVRATNDSHTPNTTADKSGYYLQFAHNFTKADTGVLMYDVYQDKSPSVQASSGRLTEYNIGLIHALDPSTRVKLFYTIVKEEKTSNKNNLITLELISLY